MKYNVYIDGEHIEDVQARNIHYALKKALRKPSELLPQGVRIVLDSMHQCRGEVELEAVLKWRMKNINPCVEITEITNLAED